MRKLKLLPLAAITGMFLFFTACDDAENGDYGDNSDTTAVTIQDGDERMASADGNRYTINQDQSEMMWLGTKPEGQHYGTLDLGESYLSVENGNITGGEIRIDMTSLKATDPLPDDKKEKLEVDLRDERFFEAGTHQYVTLNITDVQPFNGNYELGNVNLDPLSEYKPENPTHQVTGDLTIKGETNTVTFPAKIEIQDGSVNAETVFRFNRKDWNLRYKGDAEQFIADDIYFGFDVQASEGAM